MFGLLRRMWTVILGWLGLGVGAMEDPTVILEAAQNELEERLRTVKLQGATALQQKNQLELMLEEKRQELSELGAKIKQAVALGKDEAAELLIGQQIALEEAVAGLESQYAQASEVAETVKKQVKHFEAEVQKKYQEKLALKTQWKQAQINEKLNEVLSGISADATSEAWGRAKQKIQEKQARAQALTELASDSLAGQLRELDADVAKAAARERLRKLKQELGEQKASQQ